MARRKKRDEGSIIFFIVILFLLLILIVTPFALFFGKTYFSKQLKKIIYRLEQGERVFHLSAEEENSLHIKKSKLKYAEDMIDAANQRGIDLNLSINKDGSFSARSREGKTIRAIMDKFMPMKHALQQEVLELESVPHKRWKEFDFHVKLHNACKRGFFTWLAFLPICCIYSLFQSSESVIFDSCIFSSVFALITFFVSYLLHKQSASRELAYSKSLPKTPAKE